MFTHTYPQAFAPTMGNPYLNPEAARLDRLYYGWERGWEPARSFFPGAYPMGPMPNPLYATIPPHVNVAETADTVLLVCELPGIEAKDIRLEVWGQALVLTAHRPATWNNGAINVNYRSTEGHFGTLRRVFPLPVEITPAQIQATYVHGQLTIIIPKVQGPWPTAAAPMTGERATATIAVNSGF